MLTARQLTGAAPGGYTVNVASLASADSRTYAWNAGGGTVSVDYKSGDANTTQTKTFDLTGMSLDDAVSAVNSDDSSPVWAVNVGGKLSLSRRETGDHDTWGFDASGTAVGALTGSRDGADASYTVAGDSTTYTSHTNVASEGLPGVEMTFKSMGTSTVTVSAPSANSADVAAKLKAFVSAYNDTVDLVRSKLTEKRVANPQNDADAALGALFGDDALSGMLTSMRQSISSRRAGRPRRERRVRRQRQHARRAGRQAELRSGEVRRRVGREPDGRQGQARLARRPRASPRASRACSIRSRAPATA